MTILLVAGCGAGPSRLDAAEPVYPKSFPKLARQDSPSLSDCTKVVTGWCRNKGVRIDSDGSEHEAVLTHDVLNLGDLFSENDEINISIDRKEEKFFSFISPVQRLQIISRSGISWQGAWDKATCDKGYLLILQNRPTDAGPGYLVISADNTELAPAVDGSLVVKRFAASGGIIFFIVPFGGASAETYFNFPSANHAEPGNK